MEPLNNGHIWDEIFVHFSVAVLPLGRNVKTIYRQLANVECPLLEASLYRDYYTLAVLPAVALDELVMVSELIKNPKPSFSTSRIVAGQRVILNSL